MYDPPGYLWAITIAGITAIPVATCVVLYGGAMRASLGRRHAALLAGGAAVVLVGWFAASAVIAGHGWYHARLGHQVPWMPIAVAGFLGSLLALRRIPLVTRALTAPGMVSRLELPHSFRVAGGTAFLVIMALGHLPALFALPDPRRPHRIPADQRHPVRGAAQRAPARADPDSRRAATVRPAHHVCVRAAKGSATTAASHRPAHFRREIKKRMRPRIDAVKEELTPASR